MSEWANKDWRIAVRVNTDEAGERWVVAWLGKKDSLEGALEIGRLRYELVRESKFLREAWVTFLEKEVAQPMTNLTKPPGWVVVRKPFIAPRRRRKGD